MITIKNQGEVYFKNEFVGGVLSDGSFYLMFRVPGMKSAVAEYMWRVKTYGPFFFQHREQDKIIKSELSR